MAFTVCMLLSALAVASLAQRSPYAGLRPIGYPTLGPTTPTTPTTPAPSQLGDRFGEDGAQAVTPAPQLVVVEIPPEALGDRQLIEFLSKLPVEQQPFWFINQKPIKEHRERPQTYEQRPNNFIGPFPGQTFQMFS